MNPPDRANPYVPPDFLSNGGFTGPGDYVPSEIVSNESVLPRSAIEALDASRVPSLLERLKSMPEAERSARLARGLVKFIENTDRVEALSDVELVLEVINKVWGKLALGSEEDAALDELISRFEAAKGIKRDEDGKVIPP